MPHGDGYGLFSPSGQPCLDAFSNESVPRPQIATGSFAAAAWPAGNGVALCEAKGRRCLVFVGEIYNLDELRRALDLAEVAPGRILLTAYARWSTDFVLRLDGQFVFALHDDECLHLYRDLSGAKSLYYTQAAGRFAFATRLATLFHLPGVERRLNRRALHEYLHLLEIAAPNTLFEDIHALEAGQLLTCSPAGITRSRPHTKQDVSGPLPTYDEALDRLDGLMRHSVETRLADARKPAAFLSGGVDSSLLCALAARVDSRTTAVTVGFEDPRLDETPVAQAVARHLGMRQEVLRFTHAEHRRALQAFAQAAEQPMADPAITATILAFEHCRMQHDVVLDGSGADEAFGAMPPRHVRVAVEYAALLPHWLRRAAVGILSRLPGLAGYVPILDFEHPAALTRRWRGFTRLEIEALCGEPVGFEHTLFYRTHARFPRHAHFERYSALLDAMTCDRLHHAASITGLTVRYPYWNRSVDGFIRALPVDHRYRPDQPKRLLRDLLARQLPRSLWDVPKHSFDFPLHAFLTAEDFSLARRYLLDADWKRWQLLAPEGVANHARRFIAGEPGLTFRVWSLVVLAAWLEEHGY